MIDFREIPKANQGPETDTFELFARDFLKQIGYVIIENPARGADGGADMIVKDIRKGIEGDTEIKLLVSCKHYAHSSTSITPQIENNINDRILSKKCDGIICFYSTIPSTGLQTILESINNSIVFDSKKIEKYIVANEKFSDIFKRYFPLSYKNWVNLNLPNISTKLFDFYIEHELKSHRVLSFLKQYFNDNSILLLCLTKSKNIEEFLKLANIKLIVAIDIEYQLNIIGKKYSFNSESDKFTDYVTNIYDELSEFYLAKNNYAKEKLISFEMSSHCIFTTNTIILNDYDYDEFILLYNNLKSITT